MRLIPDLWRTVLMPVEHGGWGLLAEPIVLGLCLAPSVAGGLLAGAFLAAFLARQPWRLALADRARGARFPRTRVAERGAVVLSVLALGLGLAAVAMAGQEVALALLLAAPPAALALWFDTRGGQREVVAEVAGAVALAGSAPAIALAGGASWAVALGAWLLVALRAFSSILYVRARLRLDREKPAGVRTVLAVHALALLGAALLAGWGHGPWLGVAAFALLSARAVLGLAPSRPRQRPRTLGFWELGFGVVTVLLLAVGYRAGL